MKFQFLADVLGIHRNTLWYKLKEAGLQVRFSTMDDVTLVRLLKDFKKRCPESGLCYVIGWLQTNALCVQKEHIWLKWANINPVEQALWRDAMHEHCVYTLTRPNLVWHLDRHHKLIMYGIHWRHAKIL
ncbi:hypothetical protein K439DRAFT_1365354 [Ramaria rubella]|nr:hypothetical protein K439DRAFT_1365354 [Ramaria rubella]